MVKIIFRDVIKPFRLISLVTTYIFGLGLVQYVRDIGSRLDIISGVLFLLFLVLGVEATSVLGNLQQDRNLIQKLSLVETRWLRIILASLAAVAFTSSVTILIGWLVNDILWQGWSVLVFAAFLFSLFYYLTKVLTIFRPYQVLAEVFLFVIIPPAMAFFSQSDDVHRFLTLTVIPMVTAYLAHRLLIYLKTFSNDQRLEKKTIVTEIGWQKAMFFHNALILMSYLLYALIALLDFPWFLLWPVFLTLPIGFLEIWLMERVRGGKKPLWKVMQIASASVFFLPMYLIGFAFWIR